MRKGDGRMVENKPTKKQKKIKLPWTTGTSSLLVGTHNAAAVWQFPTKLGLPWAVVSPIPPVPSHVDFNLFQKFKEYLGPGSRIQTLH